MSSKNEWIGKKPELPSYEPTMKQNTKNCAFGESIMKEM